MKKNIADLTDSLLERQDKISEMANYQLTRFAFFSLAFTIFNLGIMLLFTDQGFCLSLMLFYLVSALLEFGLCYIRKFRGPAIYHFHISKITKYLAIATLLYMQGSLTAKKQMSFSSISCFVVMVISSINVIANTTVDALQVKDVKWQKAVFYGLNYLRFWQVWRSLNLFKSLLTLYTATRLQTGPWPLLQPLYGPYCMPSSPSVWQFSAIFA